MIDVEADHVAFGVKIDNQALDDLACFGARRARQLDVKAVRFRIVVQFPR